VGMFPYIWEDIPNTIIHIRFNHPNRQTASLPILFPYASEGLEVSFEATKTWKVYLDDETRQQIREIMHHLEDNYEGPSDFVQQKIKEEQPNSLAQRIKRAEQQKQDAEDKLDHLKEIRRERNQEERLEDLRDKLRSKQQELQEAEQSKVLSEAEALQLACDKELEHKMSNMPDTQYLEKKARRVKRRADKLMDSSADVQSLREEVSDLQNRVADLNGGREDWFLELQEGGVSA